MTLKLAVLRLVSLIALAASTAALIDEVRPNPVFCGFQAGCEAVTGSPFGRPLGVPLPAVGVAAFGVFFAVSLFPTSRSLRWLGVLALLAGAAGLGLFLVQALVLKRYCSLCLVVDACAMVLAMTELATPSSVVPPPPRRWLWGVGAVVALALPWGLTLWRPAPPVPEVVRQQWTPDRITVVLVTDFQCEHCRAAHPALSEFLEEHGERVRLVRFVMPLPANANARDSARAYWCAVRQGKGEAMAEALFAADDLSPAGCEKIARTLKLDLQQYQACVADTDLDEEIDAAVKWVDGRTFRGLPLIWVQDQLIQGVPDPDALRNAYQRAARKREQDPEG